MKIRTELREDECFNDGETYKKFFLGRCFGIGLKERNIEEGDVHVSFTILVEDDERWSECYGFASSYWLPDLVDAINAAQEWMERYYKKDGSYGYKFY